MRTTEKTQKLIEGAGGRGKGLIKNAKEQFHTFNLFNYFLIYRN